MDLSLPNKYDQAVIIHAQKPVNCKDHKKREYGQKTVDHGKGGKTRLPLKDNRKKRDKN